MSELRKTFMKANNDELRIAWLIWWGSIAILPFHLLICHLAGVQIELSDQAPITVLEIRTGFFVLAIWVFVFMNVYRANKVGNIKAEVITGEGNVVTGEKKPPLPVYSVSMIICMVLSECIAFFGLILCVLGDDQQVVYLFVALAGIAMVIFRPNGGEFEKYQSGYAVK